MLGRVEVTRAKGDRESGEDHRYPQGGIFARWRGADAGRHDDLRILDQDRETIRDRLQLKRDVGKDADHRDDGDKAAEQRALAITRGDEVSERGDAVDLADAQELAHH